MSSSASKGFAYGLLTASILAQLSCQVGPKYVAPRVDVPAAYKELDPAQMNAGAPWKKATPNESAARGKWWEVFHDAHLNALEERVDIGNQNIAAASAGLTAARAIVREAKSQYFPTATAGVSVTRTMPSQAPYTELLRLLGPLAQNLKVNSYPTYSLPLEASWDPDLWGRVRSTVRGSSSLAQVSAADLENVRLSAHAELAIDYFDLCGQDALRRVLEATAAAYRESLGLVQAQYQAGLANDEALASAETQLASAEAQVSNVGILRAQYEHAIALIAGQPPSRFSIAQQELNPDPPKIPVGVPSELLERRPDIAAAERAMAAANAQIGVAKAAFFPNLMLTASGGFENTSFTDWLIWPSRIWSVGPAMAETVFDAGLRRATAQQYKASYDQAVATYRQTVLAAIAQVEDNLSALRFLSEDIRKQDVAIQSAGRNLRTAVTRYDAGLDPYLNVISAQTLLLAERQAELAFRIQEKVASVQLLAALGGGWTY